MSFAVRQSIPTTRASKDENLFAGRSMLRADEKKKEGGKPQNTALQSYLAKMYGGGDAEKDPTGPSKRKKAKKGTTDTGGAIRIVDQDVTGFAAKGPGERGLMRRRNLDDDEEEDDEEAPTIANPEEAAALAKLVAKAKSGSGWTAEAEARAVAGPSGRRHDGRKASPPRRDAQQSNPDASPPRRGTRHDSPDASPPRRGARHDSPDASPPRRTQRHDSPDASPPRRRQRHDSPDASPPRRRQRRTSPDASPPRLRPQQDASPPHGQALRRDSPDASPPRRAPAQDASPPRRRQRNDSPDAVLPRQAPQQDVAAPRREPQPQAPPPRRWPQQDSPEVLPERRGSGRDAAQQRRQRHDSPDASPPRRSGRHGSPDTSPARRGTRLPGPPADTHGGAAAGPRRPPGPPERMGDGTAAGLVSAEQLAVDIQQQREQAGERRRNAEGRGAQTVYRDKATGRIMTADEALKAKEEARAARKKPSIYDEDQTLEWRAGLAQKREAEARKRAVEEEAAKPFARPDIDDTHDARLKERVRFGDPFAHLARRKQGAAEPAPLTDQYDVEKLSKSGFKIPQEVPPHSWLKRGVAAPANRYNIRPGRHWDGVNRSNGFEDKLFMHQNTRAARELEARLWSMGDM